MQHLAREIGIDCMQRWMDGEGTSIRLRRTLPKTSNSHARLSEDSEPKKATLCCLLCLIPTKGSLSMIIIQGTHAAFSGRHVRCGTLRWLRILRSSSSGTAANAADSGAGPAFAASCISRTGDLKGYNIERQNTDRKTPHPPQGQISNQ